MTEPLQTEEPEATDQAGDSNKPFSSLGPLVLHPVHLDLRKNQWVNVGQDKDLTELPKLPNL